MKCCLFLAVGGTVAAASTAPTAVVVEDLAPWQWLKHKVQTSASRRWERAAVLVEQEVAVEDANGDVMATATSAAAASRSRRLIAMPLTDTFDPPMGVFSHGHVQTGDKVSLPQTFWKAITLNKAEVPWLVSIQRLPESSSAETTSSSSLSTPPRVEFVTTTNSAADDDVICEEIPANRQLTQLVAGPLDFRAPSSYIYLPLWMMRALGLRPGEVVQVDLVTNTSPGSLAKLRPHSKSFAKDVSNPQAVLETELRHYSSLTAGTTIAMDYNEQRYWFDVVDCKSAPKGESVPCIKVQDCDIATDFLVDRETLRELQKKKRQRQQEQQ